MEKRDPNLKNPYISIKECRHRLIDMENFNKINLLLITFDDFCNYFYMEM